MTTPDDLQIRSLRECHIRSPHRFANREQDHHVYYTEADARILVDPVLRNGHDSSLSLELAGPREQIAWDPATTSAAIVTCGGLAPGLNDVIRAIVLGLENHYGVRRILGIPYGYAGLMAPYKKDIRPLTGDIVDHIHKTGGSILGSARNKPDIDAIVDTLVQWNIDILFCIGGDGTLRGAHAIAEEIADRGLNKAVIGLPKTIDNDIGWVDRTFGFDTACSIAAEVIDGAHTEATCAINGVGLVKLMGRDSGFIACAASLGSGQVNAVLIPERRFALDGDEGLLAWLERRLARKEHAVIVVAEGAGQDLIPQEQARHDASGNRLHEDIGRFLSERIKAHFRAREIPMNLKYIDPSYIIRSTPTNPTDSVYCLRLGTAAVHAAMAGKTDMLVGLTHNHITHVPIAVAVQERKRVDHRSSLYRNVLEMTGQPRFAGKPTA